MARLRVVWKWLKRLFAVPLIYLIVALLASYIPVGNSSKNKLHRNKRVYLGTNGVHLSVHIPVSELSQDFAESLLRDTDAKLIGFGWGEANFLLHVPTWSELDVKTAVTATLLPTESLMHVTRWRSKKAWMVPVRISNEQLQLLIQAIEHSFTRVHGNVVLLPNPAFSNNDNFYKSHLSYHALHTCNTWVNNCFKTAGLDACLWTPFDFGLLRRYQE